MKREAGPGCRSQFFPEGTKTVIGGPSSLRAKGDGPGAYFILRILTSTSGTSRSSSTILVVSVSPK
jgi:hypothetical protein